MYLLTPFILQNFKKVLELWGCAIFRSKIAHLSWTNIFATNDYYYFHCAKFKKILTADPELRRCTMFETKMVHLPQTIFFWEIIDIILIYVLALFIV